MDDRNIRIGGFDLDWTSPATWLATLTCELALFAAVGLLIGGLDEVLIDAVYLWRRVRSRVRGARPPVVADLPPVARRFAIFIGAWDESAVIGRMLPTLLARLDDPRLGVFVGTYPNDPATIEAVAEVAERDPRVRLVIGGRAGPTTKADCLNGLWRALKEEESWRGEPFDAVILHDAEDLVHRDELRVLSHALAGADAAQLPVRPLRRPAPHLIGGTYLDEFAEAHGRVLSVRAAVGAGLPLAGVGCAISRGMLDRIAAARGGNPFDSASLTEDYELGLTIAAMGGRTTFASVAERAGGPPAAVQSYFPATLEATLRQKTRWLLGISLAGWDRTGWGRELRAVELWMRMRDRRPPFAMLILTAAYASAVLWVVCRALGVGLRADPALMAMLWINGALLVWRVAMRAATVSRWYGTQEALLSVPRLFVGNIIAILAARRALVRYVRTLRGAPVHWDKTAHQFPDTVPAP